MDTHTQQRRVRGSWKESGSTVTMKRTVNEVKHSGREGQVIIVVRMRVRGPGSQDQDSIPIVSRHGQEEEGRGQAVQVGSSLVTDRSWKPWATRLEFGSLWQDWGQHKMIAIHPTRTWPGAALRADAQVMAPHTCSKSRTNAVSSRHEHPSRPHTHGASRQG